MSEIERARTVGLLYASKYIIDIWRTSSIVSTVWKWLLDLFERLTIAVLTTVWTDLVTFFGFYIVIYNILLRN